MDRRYEKRMNQYWAKMRAQALRNFSELDGSGWFDFWHCHIDWQGKGDKRPENRKSAIELGYEIFQCAVKFTSSISGPIQCWWFIHENSAEDAVYLHSPNPNKSPYPYDFEDVSWGDPEDDRITSTVDLKLYKAGIIRNEHGVTRVVVPNNALLSDWPSAALQASHKA